GEDGIAAVAFGPAEVERDLAGEVRLVEGVAALDEGLEGDQVVVEGGGIGGFAPAGEAVLADELDDDPVHVGFVDTGGVPERRIGDGDRRDVHLRDLHWFSLATGAIS